MNGQGTQLVLPDGLTVEITPDGYNCPAMPALGKVLNYLYPVNGCPLVKDRQVGQIGANYGWRIRHAENAILARNEVHKGAGL